MNVARTDHVRANSDLSTIYFVGSALSFPDGVVRMAAAEFPEIDFQRLLSFEELGEAALDRSSQVLAVVVYETFLGDLIASLDRINRLCPNAAIVLAYRTTDLARELLINQMTDETLSQINMLPMNMQFDNWLSVFRLILCGEQYLPRDLLTTKTISAWAPGDAADQATGSDGIDPAVHLTDREREVLVLVSEGKQNKTIACELGLSEHTVKLHIHHVIAKLGVRNRTEAAIMYLSSAKFRPDQEP